jgi:pyruvate/2-oxoglutarate dehydrogenase complex dihydrolipoamide dehydrogenase (E3) component
VQFKEDLNRFKDYQIRRLDALGVKVHLNTEVTPELVTREKPDILIAAVGAEPIVPAIPGVEKESVILAADSYNPGARIGRRVVVVGGGLAGCETGLHIAQQAKDVTILEMLDEVAIEANILHRRALMQELERYVQIRTAMKCTEIAGNGVKAIDRGGKGYLFEADTVVLAVGLRSRSGVVDALRGIVPEFTAIGDCVKPKRVLEAVRTGYDAAMAI